MPVDLKDLPAADRGDFEKRLKKYNLDAGAIEIDTLDVPPSTKTLLSISTKERSFHKPQILVSNDIDQVKRWVGLPDKLMDQAPQLRRPRVATGWLPPGLAHKGAGAGARKAAAAALAAFDRGKLSSSQLDVLRGAAEAYVRGDSRLVASYRPILTQFIPRFEIPAWLFKVIRVRSGAVLEFGPGYHVLTAWKIIIEQGGTIRSRGSLNVDCTILERA
jgi:hypothetical protein